MSTVQAQGQILLVKGAVRAVDASGHERLLHVGDVLLPGEKLIVPQGGDVQIADGEGRPPMDIEGPREVTLSAEALHLPDPTDASVAPLDAQARQVLASLEAGQDPFQNLARAEAGLDGGNGGEDGSHGFVRLLRIAENVSPLSEALHLPESHDIPTANGAGLAALQTVHAAATFGGDTQGSVVEDRQVSTNGQLTNSQPQNLSYVPEVVKGAYGSLTVDSTGKWSYTLDDRSHVLLEGEKASESFTATLSDGKSFTIGIGITGTNDVAAITGQDRAEFTENQKVASDGTLAGGGKLDTVDPDRGQAHVDPATLQFKGQGTPVGTLVIDADGHWTYKVDNNRYEVQHLGPNDTLTETFTVKSVDGTATHDIVVVVHGVNPDPGLVGVHGSGMDNAGRPLTDVGYVAANAPVENGKMVVSGLLWADPNTDTQGNPVAHPVNYQFSAHVTPPAGAWGTLQVNADGSWKYLVDPAHLADLHGSTRVETFTVFLNDGQGHDVAAHTVSVQLSPSPLQITGLDHASVTANIGVDQSGYLDASGTLTFTNPDGTGDRAHPVTWHVANDPNHDAWGTLTIDSSGHWTYKLNNWSDSVQGLGPGRTHVEHLTVTAVDGYTTHEITITIKGNERDLSLPTLDPDNVGSFSGNTNDITHQTVWSWDPENFDKTHPATTTDLLDTFSTSNHDVLDLQSLLNNEHATVDSLKHYLSFGTQQDAVTGKINTVIHVSQDGEFQDGMTAYNHLQHQSKQIILQGVDLVHGATDATIIQQLLANGTLKTDH